jgi:cellobiose-specific phosphotransferase system component IIB
MPEPQKKTLYTLHATHTKILKHNTTSQAAVRFLVFGGDVRIQYTNHYTATQLEITITSFTKNNIIDTKNILQKIMPNFECVLIGPQSKLLEDRLISMGIPPLEAINWLPKYINDTEVFVHDEYDSDDDVPRHPGFLCQGCEYHRLPGFSYIAVEQNDSSDSDSDVY